MGEAVTQVIQGDEVDSRVPGNICNMRGSVHIATCKKSYVICDIGGSVNVVF